MYDYNATFFNLRTFSPVKLYTGRLLPIDLLIIDYLVCHNVYMQPAMQPQGNKLIPREPEMEK